ncbi:MAG TPA: hypothetical protein ENN13_02580 [Candidatus Altiarchaeales archaeon]|nr:hypothetical protein [Candidatus Altiarchaeales archaeon]
MASFEELLERYREMNYVDRQNFWMTVVGIIVVIIGLIYLLNAFGTLGGIAKGATEVAVNMTGLVANTTGVAVSTT